MQFSRKNAVKFLTAILAVSLLALPCTAQAGEASSDITHTASSDTTGANAPLPQDGAASADEILSRDIIASLPEIFVVTIDSIFKDNSQRADEVKIAAGKLLGEGRENAALFQLGAAAGSAAGKTPSSYLGNYCRTILPTAGGLEAQTKFLSGFIKGYAKVGVTVISREGIEKFTAYGSRRRGHPLRTVPEGKVPSDKLEKIYVGAEAIFIPIAKTDVLKIDLFGKEGGSAKIWKILPNGTNSKSWQGGKWEREVTVRGDRIY